MKREIGDRGFIRVSLAVFFIFSLCFTFDRHSPRPDEHGLQYRAFYIQADDLRFFGKHEESGRFYRRALELARKMNDRPEMGRCMRNLGFVAWDLGNVQEASELLTEALSIGREANDAEIVRSSTGPLKIIELYLAGRRARAANDFAGSLEAFSQASDLSRKEGLPSFFLKCIRQKGSAYWHLGSLEAYFECNRRGLDIARQINHLKEEARCLNNLGAFHARRNDPYRALEYFEEARVIAARHGDKSTLAECLNNMATIHMDLGNHDRAENLFLDAFALDRSTGDVDAIVMDLNNLGSINLKIAQATGKAENLEASLAFLNESLSTLRTRGQSATKIRVLNNIGAVYYLQDKIDLARRAFEDGLSEARSIGYSEAEGTFLLNLGLAAYRNDEIPAALSLLETAALAASEANDLDVLWEAHYGLGLCYERSRDEAAALNAYRESISAVEKTRGSVPADIYKIGFTPNRIAPYQKVIDILYSDYSAGPGEEGLEDIFNIIERAKSQAFLEGVRKDVTDLVLERSANRAGRKTQASFLAPGSATQASPAEVGAPLPSGDRICGIIDVQRSLLDERSVMLEYFLGERSSYVVAIAKRTSNIYRMPDQGEIKRSLRAYLKHVSSPPGSTPLAQAASLRIGRELLFPLEKLRDHEMDTIIIIPDGMLGHLPFETLSLENGQEADLLIERFNVHYGASASSLVALKRKKVDGGHEKALMAFGGAVYDHARGSVSPLPFSMKEVQEIAKLFPGHLCDIYLGDEAIEDNVKSLPLTGYQIIHFAGHGLPDGVRPFRSALLFSPSPQQREDGYLRMDEVGLLKMDAELVVLSACGTGTGVLEKSEGPLSLSRVFFYAGARSVLASLWSVSDSATTELMKSFYASLVQGNDTGQALRSAKLELLASGRSHPFYWAGFVLSGCPTVAKGVR